MRLLGLLLIFSTFVAGCSTEMTAPEPAPSTISNGGEPPKAIATTTADGSVAGPAGLIEPPEPDEADRSDDGSQELTYGILDVASDSGKTEYGTDHLYWDEEGTLDAFGCEGTGVWWIAVGSAEPASGLLREVSAGIYTAEVSTSEPGAGLGTISIQLRCRDGRSESASIPLYVTPTARVIDTFGDPVDGAVVRLYISETEGLNGPFTALRNGDARMSPSNRATPDSTTVEGLFGWDTLAGIYRAGVEKEGCTSASGDPEAYSVPWKAPTFTIAGDIVLDCRPPNQNGPTITIADSHHFFQESSNVTIHFTVSDLRSATRVECAYGENVVVKECTSPLELSNLGDGVHSVSIFAYDDEFNSAFKGVLFAINPCETLEPTISGTEGDDRLVGTADTDIIFSYGGDDEIDALGGDDLICGGDGDDQIRSSSGDDYVSGGRGDDVVDGGDGNDLCVDAEIIIGCERPTR